MESKQIQSSSNKYVTVPPSTNIFYMSISTTLIVSLCASKHKHFHSAPPSTNTFTLRLQAQTLSLCASKHKHFHSALPSTNTFTLRLQAQTLSLCASKHKHFHSAFNYIIYAFSLTSSSSPRRQLQMNTLTISPASSYSYYKDRKKTGEMVVFSSSKHINNPSEAYKVYLCKVINSNYDISRALT